MNLPQLQPLDYAWISLFFAFVIVFVVALLFKKRKRVIKKSIKHIPLAQADWQVIEAAINKRKTTLANFTSELLKAYADEHTRY